MISDIKAGKKADNQNGLRESSTAAFDLADMCEAMTTIPSLAKQVPIKKSGPGSPDNPVTNCKWLVIDNSF